MKYQIDMPEGWKPTDDGDCDNCHKDWPCHKSSGYHAGCLLANAVPVEEPKAPAGLEDLLDMVRSVMATQHDAEALIMALERVERALSRYEAEDPLAVLADRKGLCMGHIGAHKNAKWGIMLISTSLWSKGNGATFFAPTYAECEAKARAYLNGLPDTGKEPK